jgi:hypothetical protein
VATAAWQQAAKGVAWSTSTEAEFFVLQETDPVPSFG